MISLEEEAKRLAAFSKRQLALSGASLPAEYYYSSLAQCVIDAVFSIGVRYESTRATVVRFSEFFKIPIRRTRQEFLPIIEQQSLPQFLTIYQEFGPEKMAVEVYKNRQRTSARNGILKAEATARFAEALVGCGYETFQDIHRKPVDPHLEAAVRAIPGQKSGISLRYFWMLSGEEDRIKPDRMILRFLEAALIRRVAIEDAEQLLLRASEILRPEFPELSPRLLDYVIWNFQRSLPVSEL